MESEPVSGDAGYWILDSGCLIPLVRPVLPDLSAVWRAGRRHSRINVLLPEPLTPVTSTSRARGMRTVRFLRLFLPAFCRVNQPGAAIPPVGDDPAQRERL